MSTIIHVRWETLNGNVYRKQFTNWTDAEAFAAKKEESSSVQWVDIEEKS